MTDIESRHDLFLADLEALMADYSDVLSPSYQMRRYEAETGRNEYNVDDMDRADGSTWYPRAWSLVVEMSSLEDVAGHVVPWVQRFQPRAQSPVHTDGLLREAVGE